METSIRRCDKCKKEAREDIQKEMFERFEKIEILFGRYTHCSYNYKRTRPHFLLCEDCLKKIGIVRIEKAKAENIQQSIGDRLYDIVSDLVRETNQNI